MSFARAPYGRHGDLETAPHLRNASVRVPYRGETYYGMPALKTSYYGWLVVLYFFIGGLASAAQFLATAIDLFGTKADRPVVRAGRYLALVGALVSPVLLIADLHTPQRWYNMLRIFRRTSPMSIGSWALMTFGTLSGVVAFGQMLQDVFGWGPGRWVARLFSLPAALAAGIVALYTGTLLAATNIPMWAGAFPFVSSLFTSSAASTATAALILATSERTPPDTQRRLGWFALMTSSAELLFAALVQLQWRRRRTTMVLREGPFRPAWRLGVLGLGILTPLTVHLVEVLERKPAGSASRLAALATLLGGLTLRAVFVFGGKESGRRPQEYFRLAQPERMPH